MTQSTSSLQAELPGLQSSLLLNLPNRMQEKIHGYLFPEELARSSPVCRRWEFICKTSGSWKVFTILLLGEQEIEEENEATEKDKFLALIRRANGKLYPLLTQEVTTNVYQTSIRNPIRQYRIYQSCLKTYEAFLRPQLQSAVQKGDHCLTSLFLQAEIKPTPLMLSLAVFGGHDNIVKLLLKSNVQPTLQHVETSLIHGHKSTIKILMEQGLVATEKIKALAARWGRLELLTDD